MTLTAPLRLGRNHEGHLGGGRAEGLGAAVGPSFTFFELLFGHGDSLGSGRAGVCFTPSFRNAVYAFTMSSTRGGPNRAKRFEWHFDITGQCVIIRNEKNFVHTYPVGDLVELLSRLEAAFGANEFPLANNVEKLGAGTERPGLGMTLMSIKPNTTYAQGASYLGVVLEELGYLRWNGRSRGIGWRLTGQDVSLVELDSRLKDKAERS